MTWMTYPGCMDRQWGNDLLTKKIINVYLTY